MDEGEGLDVSLSNILKAFEMAGPYATGKSNRDKFEHRWEVALDIIDRAVMESDRGLKLLELTAEMAFRGGNEGTIYIGPIGK